jgi:putative flippase GtrA
MRRLEPLRYAAVGAACAALHVLVMLGGDRLGLHYVASTLVSYGLVVVVGYGLHVRVTFAQRASAAAFARYAVAMAANYPLSLLLMFALCDLAGAPVPLAAPVATVLLAVWNYGACRWAVVGRRNAPA